MAGYEVVEILAKSQYFNRLLEDISWENPWLSGSGSPEAIPPDSLGVNSCVENLLSVKVRPMNESRHHHNGCLPSSKNSKQRY